jgi:hypothetical protein
MPDPSRGRARERLARRLQPVLKPGGERHETLFTA